MAPQFIATADWHLEHHVYADTPQMWGDSYWALTQVVDLALEQKLPLIAAGDLVECLTGGPDPQTLSVLRRQISRLENSRLPLYFVTGQHDRHPLGYWLQAVSSWPQPLHRKIYQLPGLGTIGGLDYQTGQCLPSAFAQLTGTDVLVCHQSWSELLGSQRLADGCLAELVPAGVKLVVAGDYHSPQRGNIRPGCWVLSPGPTSFQAVHEGPIFSVAVVHDDLQTAECVQLKSRLRLSLDVTMETLESQVQVALEMGVAHQDQHPNLPDELRTPLWQIRCPSSLHGMLYQKAKERAHIHFLAPRLKTRIEPSQPCSEWQDRNGTERLVSALESAQQIPEPVRKVGLRLLRAHDGPVKEAHRLIAEARELPNTEG